MEQESLMNKKMASTTTGKQSLLTKNENGQSNNGHSNIPFNQSNGSHITPITSPSPMAVMNGGVYECDVIDVDNTSFDGFNNFGPTMNGTSIPSNIAMVDSASTNSNVENGSSNLFPGMSNTTTISLTNWANMAYQEVASSAALESLASTPSSSPAYFAGADLCPPSSHAKTKPVLSSEKYLLPALDVAILLAGQVCQGCGEKPTKWPTRSSSGGNLDSGSVSSGGRDGQSSVVMTQSVSPKPLRQLPSPGSNWSDSIVIRLFSSSTHSSSFRRISNISNNSSNSNFEKESLDSLHETNLAEENHENNVRFQNVAGAEILVPSNNGQIVGDFSDNNITSSSRECNQNQILYSLGIVFYELFSGGKRPPELSSPRGTGSNERPGGLGGIQLGPVDENGIDLTDNDLYNPLSPAEANAVDLSSALQFLDELGGTDEIFGPDQSSNDQIEESSRKQARSNRPNHPNANSASTPPLPHTSSHGGTFNVSLTPLQNDGLPTPLCDLLQNLIDCVNGDLRNDESYTHPVDLLRDLELMRAKPHRFLHDLDVTKLSVTGLQMEKFGTTSVWGRDNEFTSLLDTYQRSIVGSRGVSAMAILSGPSGSGKSTMAMRLSRTIVSSGGMFLQGKFDRLSQGKPFSAIAAAFDKYCDILAQKGGETMSEVAQKLKIALGGDVMFLKKVIPNLDKILGTDREVIFDSSFVEWQDCVDAQKRLQYLLYKFVEIISSFSEAPITLFLDDLQWADTASIEVIKRILLNLGLSYQKKQFFFLGCCRSDEMGEDHPVSRMMSGVRNFGVNIVTVEIDCFDKETLNTMISELLCLSPRLTRTLADIVYHRTKGSPLFFSQLMMSLNREGLLHLSLSRRRWEWSIEKIQSRKLPDDVAMFFINTITKLPTVVRSALCVLSCFGTSTKQYVLEILEKEMGLNLLVPLDTAVSESLLEKVDDRYCFVHDRIQEAAYNMMKPEERSLYHFNYGLALSTEALKTGNESVLFTAVGQVNRGGPSATADADQGVAMANLNLFAGNKAIEMSDFTSAFALFNHGISFLPKDHWSSHYTLSLQLFEASTRCSVVIGEFDSLNMLSQQVLDHAKSFKDKLNTFYTTITASITSLALMDKLPWALQMGASILSQLGEDLPQSTSESDLSFHLAQTHSMLAALSDDDLLNYKLMTDPSKTMAMKFLTKLQTAMLMIRPPMQPFVTLKILQLSLVFGMSPMSPVGFAYYGSLLAVRGNITEGYRFCVLAKRLFDRVGSREVAGEVYVFSTHVICFVEMLQSSAEYFVKGHNISMASGDMSNAMLNSFFYLYTVYFMGTKLPEIKEKLSNARQVMEQHNQVIWLSQLSPIEESLSLLMGDGSAENYEMMFTESPSDSLRLENNPHRSLIFYFHKMNICFMFRKYDQMKHFAEKYFEWKQKNSSTTLFNLYAMRVLINGLVSFWIYRESNDISWANRGKKAISLMSSWKSSSSWNFENKLSLLEAEGHFCIGNFESAKISYDKAISSAREHRFIHEEALACELAGYFFSKVDKRDLSLEYFSKAHQKYHEWGAIAKSNELYEQVTKLMSPSVESLDSSSPFAPSLLSSPASEEHEDESSRTKTRKRLTDAS